jgi:hypothetical protein
VTVAVQTHRFAQLLKLKVVKFNDHTLAAQPECEICRPVTMLGVATVIMALAIMQEGKPREDRWVDVERRRERAAVMPDASPVGQPMNALVEIQPKLRANDSKGFTNDRDIIGSRDNHLLSKLTLRNLSLRILQKQECIGRRFREALIWHRRTDDSTTRVSPDPANEAPGARFQEKPLVSVVAQNGIAPMPLARLT